MARAFHNTKKSDNGFCVHAYARASMRYVFASLLFTFCFSFCAPDYGRYGERPLSHDELNHFDLKIGVALGQVKEEPRLRITMSFVMPRDYLYLKLPDLFLRKEHLYNRIENLSVSPLGKLYPHKTEPSVYMLEHKKGERVELSYLFKPNDQHDVDAKKESFSAPIIRDDYFQFVGLMALIYPLALLDAPSFPVTLNWEVPKDFHVYNSYGGKDRTQSITTNFDRLRDAFFMAGKDVRVYQVNIKDRPVFLTFEGVWDQIDDEDFIRIVTKLIQKQRETWRDDNFPYFLVHFLSTESDCKRAVNFAGTAHTNSFRASFPSGCALISDMKHLLSHELMHMWIGKKIKVGKQRGHIDGKWFTEGFTDYFGRLLAFRAGIFSEEEYFRSLNRQMEKYYVSRERLVPLTGLVTRMYRNGFSNRSLEDVPYQQGEIMALRINQMIKTESKFTKSLDDVIRDMLFEADRAGGTKNFSVEEISRIVDRYAEDALEDEFAKVKEGKLFTPPELEGCSRPYEKYQTDYFYVRRPVSSAIISYGSPKEMCKRWLE